MLRLLLDRHDQEATVGVTTTNPIPACPHPGCGAATGDRYCYTPTGFIRHLHTVRKHAIEVAAGRTGPAPEKKAGRNTRSRPKDKQALILAAAVADGGLYEVSGYGFHREAQRRASVLSMVDESRGWMTHLRETQHGDLYEITTEGRNALARYQAWLRGEK
jgi:hypothetical protein